MIRETFIDAGNFSVQYNNYKHAEIESHTGEIGTAFKNNTFFTREFLIKRKRAGFRAVSVSGECIATLNRDWRRGACPSNETECVRALWAADDSTSSVSALQFGGRFETQSVTIRSHRARGSANRDHSPAFPARRAFAFRTGGGTAFVANYSHSYRAPALEELYNLGPHPGNLRSRSAIRTLERELGDGIDFGLRHSRASAL